MSTLHIVNKTASSTALAACLRVARGGDSVLLIEDGTYLISSLLQRDVPSGIRCYALQEDVQARGIEPSVTDVKIAMVDYSAFVELVCQHARSVSWF